MNERPSRQLFHVRRVAAVAWALALATAVNLFLQVRWWHPYCRAQTDGPGYSAIGLPLPFAEPTGASSLEYWWMPHAYLFDTLALALLAWLLLRQIPSPGGVFGGRAVIKVVAAAGLAALLLVGGGQAFAFSLGWRPVMAFPSDPDHYIDFRPALLMDQHRDGSCQL